MIMALREIGLSQEDLKHLVSTSSVHRRLQKAWRSDMIKTISDLEYLTYGMYVTDERLAKAQVTIGTAGLTNNLYGAKLFRQIAYGANALGALGFKPWQTNGYRTVTAAAATTTPGLALGANIPTPLVITAANIDISPTLSGASFEIDSTAAKVNPKNDSASWEEYQKAAADEFRNRLSREVVCDADTDPATLYGLETIDRIIASYAELAYGDANNSTLDASDLDIYGKDRDGGATVYDSYVSGLAYGSGDRYLALSHIDEVITNCKPYWENRMYANKFILTGADTSMRISQLHKAEERVNIPTKRIQFSVNGVQSAAGIDAGYEVAAYNGIPIIEDDHIVQDTISRFYMIDKDNLHIGTVTPPTYLETSDRDFLTLGRFAIEGVWYMEGELVCTGFPGQGKGRDFK